MQRVNGNIVAPWLGLLLAAVLAAALAGCQEQAPQEPEAEAETAPAFTDEEITKTLLDAAAKEYDTFTFTVDSSTKATYPVGTTGQTQQTTAKTKMAGEMDTSGENPRLHMTMEANNGSTGQGDVSFEMFVQDDDVVIQQDDQTYVDTVSNTGIDGYYSSIPQIVTAESVQSAVDMASSLKMEEREDTTVVTLVADPTKLTGQNVEGTGDDGVSQATGLTSLVTVYTINEDGYISQVAMTGGANGTPTYHVRQTYAYSKFDDTQLPEMPDTRYAGINLQTDENGRQFVADDDGTRYYLAEDGQFYAESQPVYEQQPQQTVTKRKVTTTTTTPTPEATQDAAQGDAQAAASGASTDAGTAASGTAASGTDAGASGEAPAADPNEGRAYITAGDGTIHFLDEPGSEIRDFGGTRVFIDADGNWYFLSD